MSEESKSSVPSILKPSLTDSIYDSRMEIFSFVNVIFTSSHTVEGFHGQNVLGVKIVNVKTQIELKFALINIAHFMTYIYWLWQELMEVYKKEVPRNSPLHSVRAGEDHIHKGENFHPRVVNCVSACTTITDKILTLSFFLLFFSSSFGPGLALLLPPHSVWFCLILFHFQILDNKVTFILSAQMMSVIEFHHKRNHWLFLTSI